MISLAEAHRRCGHPLLDMGSSEDEALSGPALSLAIKLSPPSPLGARQAHRCRLCEIVDQRSRLFRRKAMAHEPHVQIEVGDFGHSPSNGVMDPRVIVAKCAAAEPR